MKGRPMAPMATPANRMRLRSDVSVASRVVAPMWPLNTFIAVNPLGGFEAQPFADAVAAAGDLFGAKGTLSEPLYRQLHAAGRVSTADLEQALVRGGYPPPGSASITLGDQEISALSLLVSDMLYGVPIPPPSRQAHTRSERHDPRLAALIDDQTAKWCGVYCDREQAVWSMPGRESGLYTAWRPLAPRDRSLPKAVRQQLGELPDSSEDAALTALTALGVPLATRQRYLRAHLSRQPGWAGHLRWRSEKQHTDDLLDYLTIRLCYEAAWLPDPDEGDFDAGVPATTSTPVGAVPDATSRARRVARMLSLVDADEADIRAAAGIIGRLPVTKRTMVWLDGYESHYREHLLASLSRPPANATAAARPAAHLVCCIDVRSEGLRRHLEAAGNYQTLGFAGFFAVAIQFQKLGGGHPSALCPVLLEPRNAIRETPLPGTNQQVTRYLSGEQQLRGVDDAFHAAKDSLLAPFVLAEAAGWIAGPAAAAKTFHPARYNRLRGRVRTSLAPPVDTGLSIHDGFSADEQILFAETALTMMGLHAGFGRLVVLCGHGASTENNPYVAALDCGACGGQRGGPNARTAAAILNTTAIRQQLAGRGIVIPDDTWFLAAEHDTATDQVMLLDEHLLPDTHRRDAAQLTADLSAAGRALSAERCHTLPGAPRRPSPASAARHTYRRSSDWAQVFPEWGLAGNAAFIVGPRHLTAGLNLQRRAFLHSYDPDLDADGTALETILTAPLVVAQWINCQYYFSTVASDSFGAGTKTIHNVIGGIGVLAGHNGDLQVGLPRQSIAFGQQLIHEPMRLLAIVQAPLERIDAIIARNTILQRLIGNEWIHLAARDETAQSWQRHTSHGWQPFTNPTKEPAQ